MRYCVFDIEADNIDPLKATKVFCVCYRYLDGETSVTLTGETEIRDFFSLEGVVYSGHNIIDYDLPVLENVYGIKVPLAKVADTLGLSYYLFPNRKKHSLESYDPSVKVGVEDWSKLSLEGYIKRCLADVDINHKLLRESLAYLDMIYTEGKEPIIGYCNFKLHCIRSQKKGITVDREKCRENLEKITSIYNEKEKELIRSMPRENAKLIRKRPDTLYKADGNLSERGKQWISLCREKGLPIETGSVHMEPNPQSVPQIKKWLFSLGWEPDTHKISKSTGKKVEQISLPFGKGLTKSVKKLFEKEPRLSNLDDYYVLRHRMGILSSFLELSEKTGRVISSIHGFTNTMRVKHKKPVANLPKPSKLFGKEIRETLVPGSGNILCGSDVSSLEDSTKQHYIYFYDPEYVRDMQVEGFDPHLDIGELAGLLTKEESAFYKAGGGSDKGPYLKISSLRSISKNVNFSATYGAGPKKMSETGDIPMEQAKQLYDIYWQRNWAVREISSDCTVKEVTYKNIRQKWLYNPVSGLWMLLKEEKDRFSTLNQSTGVYVFDRWLYHLLPGLEPLGARMLLQYHDEILLEVVPGTEKEITGILEGSMEKVNEELDLNVRIKISLLFGDSYDSVH